MSAVVETSHPFQVPFRLENFSSAGFACVAVGRCRVSRVDEQFSRFSLVDHLLRVSIADVSFITDRILDNGLYP